MQGAATADGEDSASVTWLLGAAGIVGAALLCLLACLVRDRRRRRRAPAAGPRAGSELIGINIRSQKGGAGGSRARMVLSQNPPGPARGGGGGGGGRRGVRGGGCGDGGDGGGGGGRGAPGLRHQPASLPPPSLKSARSSCRAAIGGNSPGQLSKRGSASPASNGGAARPARACRATGRRASSRSSSERRPLDDSLTIGRLTW